MSTDDFISVGKITATHGVRGDVKIASSSTFFSETKPPYKMELRTSTGVMQVEVVRIKLQKKGRYDTWLAHFRDMETLNAVEPLCGNSLFVKSGELPPAEDNEFYIYQLLGLEAVSDGKKTGYTITDVLDNPAHTIFQFALDENIILVPFVEKYIGDISTDKKEVEVFYWEDWFEV